MYIALDYYLCAIDVATMTVPSLTKNNWCVKLVYQNRFATPSDASPAIGADGTIYLGDRENNLTAFDPVDGSRKWTYNHGFQGDIWTSPAIGPDGAIYFAHDQSLDGYGVVTALNPGGSLRWKYRIGTFLQHSSPAIDKRGIIYIGDLKGVLHAFQETEESPGQFSVVRLWKKQIGTTPGITASPVVSADSKTLYIGSTAGLTALDITDPACFGNPACNPVKWTFPTSGRVDQTPALATDDTLYFGALNGTQKTIYAVNPDGSLKWKYGPTVSQNPVSAHIVIGADGVVYAGMHFGVYAFGRFGALLWTYQTSDFVQAPPVIGPSCPAPPASGPCEGATFSDGGTAVLYVPGRNWNMYAISSPRKGLTSNQPPIASAGPDQTVSVGQVVTFDGSASSGIPTTLCCPTRGTSVAAPPALE